MPRFVSFMIVIEENHWLSQLLLPIVCVLHLSKYASYFDYTILENNVINSNKRMKIAQTVNKVCMFYCIVPILYMTMEAYQLKSNFDV